MQLTTAHGRRAWRSSSPCWARTREIALRISRDIGFPVCWRERLLIGKYEKMTSTSTSFSVRLLDPVRYKLVFGHGFRPAEGPVGRNGALPGPSCAQKNSVLLLGMCGARGFGGIAHCSPGISICVTSAGRFTYERRVEYHQPLVSQPARLSPCVCESASYARLALKLWASSVVRRHGANAATSG